MMTDPYKVLGLPSTATDDEVKQAYRRLAKRYHPDANPGDKNAERRMQEINAAYDEIVNRKANPNSGRTAGGYDPFGGFGGGYGSYGGYGGSYGGERAGGGSDYFTAARSYNRFGRYREALNVLADIQERNAEWYYLSAVANAGLGNRVLAQQHAQQAVRLEPDNAEYRSLYERLQQPGRTYSDFGRTFSMPIFGNAGGGLCLSLCAANLLCNLFCGRC